MPRPASQRVPYFPHFCNSHSKKTCKSLRFHFRNDGYTFWFILLEILGDSEGHYIDCKNTDDWEYLVSETQIDEDTCNRILSLLVKVKAIDAKLWNEHQIIWSQNFVNHLAGVYKKRNQPLPSKPDPESNKDKESKERKPAAKTRQPNPAYTAFVDEWFKLYEKYKGTKKVKFGDKEGAQVKRDILSRIDGAKVTLDWLLARLAEYFADKKYILTDNNGYTIAGFNRWLERPAINPDTESDLNPSNQLLDAERARAGLKTEGTHES